MDTGHFDGIIAKSLLRPHPRRMFSQTSIRNAAKSIIGADIFTFGTMTAIHDTDGEWANFATAGTTNSTEGIATSVAGGGFSGRPSSLPLMFARIRLEQVTNVRFWFGFAAFAPGTFMGSDDPTDHSAMIRFSTAAGDTKFQCYRNDNSGGGTADDSGVTVVAGTVYDLMIRFVTQSKIEYWINGVRVATATSGNMPSTSQDLGNICRIATLENAAKNLRVQSIINVHNA